MQRAADAWLGRRPIYTNQCEGLHYPFLPADEFFDPELFPWLGELEAGTATILAELQAILADPRAELTPYISLPPGVPASKWSGLDQSLDWGAFHLWKEGERFDEACARAPRTAALVELLPMCDIKAAPRTSSSLILRRRQPSSAAHTGVTNVAASSTCRDRPADASSGRRRARSWVEARAFAFDDTIDCNDGREPQSDA